MLLLPTVLPDTALFLDFDGTLVDIAATPDAVRVPGGLVSTLDALHRQLGGALAIVTGRPIADIDQFLHPLLLPVAGEHGAQYRMADGSRPSVDQPPLEDAVEAMSELAAQHAGLLVERKPHSVALHYRHAPQLEALCRATMQQIVAGRSGVELLYGKCVVEVKPAGIHKGQAIAYFMTTEPFAGRVPIFAGDDVTDESGIAAAQQLGGRGIKIGEGASLAQHRCLSSAALRGWLASARTTLAPLAASVGRDADEAAAGQPGSEAG
ncbi:trehalose-phosphatase [Xylophilus rhododendri]|uniref:Trehalose 6-phosphate phosphatase n=1 Tax=Xylophilus rhododendri TaxID=2697032 RepID=A0A857J962_9BURK|nr:trehalose-phosphatase [Xylophilus rhododendri]QHI99542.1 trehalose-phosphatase [Xylophilus rhododendri]